jgi:hypothetical protein
MAQFLQIGSEPLLYQYGRKTEAKDTAISTVEYPCLATLERCMQRSLNKELEQLSSHISLKPSLFFAEEEAVQMLSLHCANSVRKHGNTTRNSTLYLLIKRRLSTG